MTTSGLRERVDVRRALHMALQHVVICGPDETIESALRAVDDAVAELIEAARRVSNRRHTHSAIDSVDGGETCGLCGRNWRDTGHHFVVGESIEGDMARLRTALAALTPEPTR